MFYQTAFKSLMIALPLLVMSGCKDKDKLKVTHVDINTSQVDQSTYINFQAQVKVGKLKFPNIEVPILNPATMTSFGQMALTRSGGANKIYVSVDLEAASNLDPSLGYGLPNGREIPTIMGAQNIALVGIPILENSRIYVGGDIKKDLILGLALAIPAFDNIMNQVAIPLNIFADFPFSSTMTGYAGLFTSPAPGQNGLGLFIKKSANGPAASLLLAGQEMELAPSELSPSAKSEMDELDYDTLRRLNRLLNRKATLQVR